MTEVNNCDEALLESSERLFRDWMEQVNKICLEAVFKQKHNLIQQAYKHLEEKEKTFKETMAMLFIHVEKSSNNAVANTSTFARVAQKDMNDAAVERLAAAFPLMSSVVSSGSPPHPLPPAPSATSAPFPGFSKPSGKSVPPPGHTLSSKNSLANNGRDKEGRPNPEPSGSLAQLQQLADESDDRSSVDSDGSREIIPKKVFLTNLAWDSDARTIAQHFKQFGPVTDVKIFRFQNGELKGSGAVEFADISSAEKSINTSKHIIDGREVVASHYKVPKEKSSERPTTKSQVFLGGVPTFLSKAEVETAIGKYCKVRDLKLNSERGYGYLSLENESDVARILANGYIKIGEKMVECKPNKRC